MKYLLPIAAVVFTISFVAIPLVWSDAPFTWGEHEEHEEHEEYEYRMSGSPKYENRYKAYERRFTGVANIDNELYREECGSCHMAYPAGLLPAVSWEKIMGGLEDHFGDNAELDDESNKEIKSFLQKNASDNVYYRRSRQFTDESDLKNARIRISDSNYFRHEHDEIPGRLVTGNIKVKSFSHCNACHLQAEQGIFNEDDINIPGYGKWDD
jgi:hypothetical protein